MAQTKSSSTSQTKSQTSTRSGSQSSEPSESGNEMPKKGEVAEEIRGTVKVLQGDLTKLAGPKADKAISHWQTMLETLDVSGTKPVATELGKLRDLLSADDLDGKAISRTLSSLATKVRKVSEEVGGIVGTALNALASGLEQGAESLTNSGGTKKKVGSH